MAENIDPNADSESKTLKTKLIHACPKCSKVFDETWKSCLKCSIPLVLKEVLVTNELESERKVFCRQCGSEIAMEAVVCVSCGCSPREGKKFCQNCGAQTNDSQVMCIKCKKPLAESLKSAKSRIAAGLLGLVLGPLGIHRFYLGYTNIGIAQLALTFITFGIGGLWGFIEGFLILIGQMNTDAKGQPLRN